MNKTLCSSKSKQENDQLHVSLTLFSQSGLELEAVLAKNDLVAVFRSEYILCSLICTIHFSIANIESSIILKIS